MKQLQFGFIRDYKKEFGGSLLTGARKSKRPLSTKHPIHLVLKSSHHRVFAPQNQSLERLIRQQAQRFNIRIYDLALNWSHIHMLFRIRHREDYNKFIRALTSIMSLKFQSHKNCDLPLFTLRPFTRIVSWGRDFRRALNYHVINQLESLGLFRRPAKNKPTAKQSRKGVHEIFTTS